MLLELRAHGEGVSADGADVGLLPAVAPQVHVQGVLRAEPHQATLGLQGAREVGRVRQLENSDTCESSTKGW